MAARPRRPDADVEIRAEQSGDEGSIRQVVADAFDATLEADLVEAIRRSENYIPELSLVAMLDGRIVGHVMVSYTELHEGDNVHRVAQLAPLAVDPTVQRIGIGSKLVREVAKLADERGEPMLILEGDPRYYGRLGFEHSAPLGITFDLPSWAPPQAAQVLRLSSYDPSVRGQVVYPPAFDVDFDHR